MPPACTGFCHDSRCFYVQCRADPSMLLSPQGALLPALRVAVVGRAIQTPPSHFRREWIRPFLLWLSHGGTVTRSSPGTLNTEQVM